MGEAFKAEQVLANNHHKISATYSSTIHDLLDACLQLDPSERPTCIELLNRFPLLTYKATELIASHIFRSLHEECFLRRVEF